MLEIMKDLKHFPPPSLVARWKLKGKLSPPGGQKLNFDCQFLWYCLGISLIIRFSTGADKRAQGSTALPDEFHDHAIHLKNLLGVTKLDDLMFVSPQEVFDIHVVYTYQIRSIHCFLYHKAFKFTTFLLLILARCDVLALAHARDRGLIGGLNRWIGWQINMVATAIGMPPALENKLIWERKFQLAQRGPKMTKEEEAEQDKLTKQ